jgi:hypothetical protein
LSGPARRLPLSQNVEEEIEGSEQLRCKKKLAIKSGGN